MQPTIVNNVETLSNLPWIVANGGAGLRRPRRRDQPRAPACSRCRATSRTPACTRSSSASPPSATSSTPTVYGGGIRDGHELKAFIPGGASAPWFFEEHLDLPLEAGAVGAAGSMLGSGAIVVMDETTDVVKAALAGRAVLRPRVVRQVHAVPRGHDLAGEDPRAHPRRPRPPRATSTCCSTSATTSAPASPGRPSRPRSARSARRRCRRSPRRSCASATSSRPTSAAARCTVADRRQGLHRRARRRRSERPDDRHRAPRRPTRHRHHRRQGDRGPQGRAGHRRRRARTASTSRASATTRG